MVYSEAVKIQEVLKSFGLYKGAIDGIFGRQSKAALRGFQRMNGLKADAIAGPKTRGKLFPHPMPSRDIDAEDDNLSPEKVTWPRQRDVQRYYGKVGTNQTRLELPFKMKIAWDLRKSVSKITVHEKVHDSAKRAFDRIANEYTPEEINRHGFNLFGGSLNVRKMRGGSKYSMHSWGIAIDFDPIRNQFRWKRDRAYLAKPECEKFWKAWEDEGWLSLGRARNFDHMHIQAARL